MRYTVATPAPQDNNTLASYEGKGVGSSLLPTIDLQSSMNQIAAGNTGPSPSTGLPPGGGVLLPGNTGSTPAPTPKPSFGQNLTNFLTSDGFTNLVGTGVNIYAGHQQQQAARDYRRGEEERARAATLLAQTQAQAAQQRMSMPQMPQGMPAWALPAGAAAAGLLLILLVSRKK